MTDEARAPEHVSGRSKTTTRVTLAAKPDLSAKCLHE